MPPRMRSASFDSSGAEIDEAPAVRVDVGNMKPAVAHDAGDLAQAFDVAPAVLGTHVERHPGAHFVSDRHYVGGGLGCERVVTAQ